MMQSDIVLELKALLLFDFKENKLTVSFISSFSVSWSPGSHVQEAPPPSSAAVGLMRNRSYIHAL